MADVPGGNFGRRGGFLRGRRGSAGLGLRMNWGGPPFGVGVCPLDRPDGEALMVYEVTDCSTLMKAFFPVYVEDGKRRTHSHQGAPVPAQSMLRRKEMSCLPCAENLPNGSADEELKRLCCRRKSSYAEQICREMV